MVRLVYKVEAARAKRQSVRATAAEEGVSASGLYHYLERASAMDAPVAERQFFGSPDGVELLHRIVTALHVVFGQAGGCGVDRVCEFLALSRLDRFTAASHAYHHALAVAIEGLLGDYGDEQRAKLGPRMPAQELVICEDETFHPAMCLVAIAAESDMILVETYSEKRDGATWTTLVNDAVAGLPVTVAKVVGDEAKGIAAHARSGLGCHFGPDLFHPQHDLSKATALPLAARLEAPKAAWETAQEHTTRWRTAKSAYETGPRGPGRPTDYDRRIADAQVAEDVAQAAYDAVVKDQADVRAANRSLSDAYHPFDLESGAIQTPETVHARFLAAFATIDDIVSRAQLSESCRERVNKARRLIPKFIATLTFFHGQLARSLDGLDLSEPVLDVVRTQLVPGLYLARAAQRARNAAERAAINGVSVALLAQARAQGSPFMSLDVNARVRVESAVLACLQLFVRSSACVEGRNGRLALLHHGLHRLSKRRLKALTVLHNYYARRDDRTTAAERFFGQKPDDLFDWLLDRLDVPALPRSRRLKLAA